MPVHWFAAPGAAAGLLRRERFLPVSISECAYTPLWRADSRRAAAPLRDGRLEKVVGGTQTDGQMMCAVTICTDAGEHQRPRHLCRMTSKIVDLTYPGKEGEMGVLRTRVAGVVTLLLLRQPAPLHFTTYVEYWQALGQPDWQPFAGKIRLAGGLGFGSPLLSWAIVAVLILKPRARAFHGDARFASRGDLARAGLLKPSPEGVIIGKAGGDYLYLGGTRHIVMTAPTRTGKTTSIAIPVLLT